MITLKTADDAIILIERDISDTVKLSYPCELPRFSKVVHKALQTGSVYKEWDQFVRESAIFYLPDMPASDGLARIAYHSIGRSMFDAFPCIASAGQNAWVSTLWKFVKLFWSGSLQPAYKDAANL